MKTVDVNSLPDRGNKIREQIKDLEAKLDEIDKIMKVMKVSDVKGRLTRFNTRKLNTIQDYLNVESN